MAGFGREVKANLEEAAGIIGIRERVPLLLNLRHRLLSRLVELQLYYIYELWSLDNKVDTPIGGMYLCLDTHTD